MRQISTTEWRKNFEKYVDETSAGVTFIVTRCGKPHCRLVPLSEVDLTELERFPTPRSQDPENQL